LRDSPGRRAGSIGSLAGCMKPGLRRCPAFWYLISVDCVLCRGVDGDLELGRVQVWQDELWRLTMSLEAEVLGFSYLEPKRHIPHVTDLDGDEARTFGDVLAGVSSALQEEAEAEVVYVYVFGEGVPHLHVHLAPHRGGDALNAQLIRGPIEERPLPSGATVLRSRDFPPLPESQHRATADRVARRLAHQNMSAADEPRLGSQLREAPGN
jgi:diadenosine tetraphosphate (Ap4A) HIT family hydrolase